MSPFNNMKVWGLGIGILAAAWTVELPAQITKGLTKTTKAVTAPMKDVQGATKTVVEPIKDARTATKAVTDAPKTVVNEVKSTEKAVESAGNEVKKAKTDLEKAADKVDGDKSKKAADSTAVGVKPEAAKPAGEPGRMRSTESPESATPTAINYQAGSGAESASTEPNYDYRRVLLPPGKGKTNLKSASKGSKSPAGASGPAAPPAPVKPDYSSSPARDALESADFAMETLTDLFQYVVWDGPEADHNMRSIDYTLKQLKRDIDEVRMKDPDRSVWNYEKQYREWRNTFVQHGGK